MNPLKIPEQDRMPKYVQKLMPKYVQKSEVDLMLCTSSLFALDIGSYNHRIILVWKGPLEVI